MLKRVKYGKERSQFGDLYRLEGSTLIPVMIVIHGGYWKDNHTLDTYATKRIVEKYQDSTEVAVWNLEYRRMEFEGENTSAPWPAIMSDVANGIDFLREIANEYKLDLNRILLVGHSAGGHLATWATSRKNLPVTSELYCADPLLPTRTISISAVLDFENCQDLSKPHQIQRLPVPQLTNNAPVFV